MALRDVLEFGHRKRDEAPATASLIDNIAAVLAQGDAAAGTYNTDEVLQAIVLAMREMELLAARDREEIKAVLLMVTKRLDVISSRLDERS